MTWAILRRPYLCLYLFFVASRVGADYVPPAVVNGDTLWQRCHQSIDAAKALRNQIYQAPKSSHDDALELYNKIAIILDNATSEAGLLSQVHPSALIRTDAEKCEQATANFATELSLDRRVYEAIRITAPTTDPKRVRMLEHSLRDFRRSGVDKDEATQKKIKELKEELVTISQQFAQNIKNDRFFIELDNAHDLDGLPADYIDAHRKLSGKYVIDTSYPDYIPFMKYAKNDGARKALRFKYLSRGQKNGPVLEAMLQKRHELAQLLGYRTYAQYVAEDKMIKTPEAIHSFIDKIAALAKVGADREYLALLSFKLRTLGESDRIEGHESSYLEEGYKKEQFGFDAQEARPYFSYTRVRDGVLQVTAELFSIRYIKVEDASVWHQSVDVYDVYDSDGKIGRIYLDMHPREAKYSHAAQFALRKGILNRQYPEGVLVCNFPNPADGDGSALMEFAQVTTFFHEFGHLLHHVFAGNQPWLPFSGVATEWDFVEAPSQLLEEWAWAPEVLERFARHYQTGELIPASLVSQMRAAEEFGKALSARQQMFYAAVSANYYDQNPQSFDPMELLKELQSKYSYYPYEEGTHFNYSFGHLDGYSAIYYTYMWSLSLAKDLFLPFKAHGLMNKDIATRYRDTILMPGGSEDAAKLVQNFLGRPFQFDAFETWLSAESVGL